MTDGYFRVVQDKSKIHKILRISYQNQEKNEYFHQNIPISALSALNISRKLFFTKKVISRKFLLLFWTTDTASPSTINLSVKATKSFRKRFRMVIFKPIFFFLSLFLLKSTE
jgi:hypothetical protein